MEGVAWTDIALMVGFAYIAVVALVRLMAAYRQTVIGEVKQQIEEELRRRPTSTSATKAASQNLPGERSPVR